MRFIQLKSHFWKNGYSASSYASWILYEIGNRDIAHLIILGSFVCLAVLFGLLFSKFLFSPNASSSLGSQRLKVSYKPT